jgi:hypothetical protein
MSRVIAYDIPGAGLGNRMFINALAYIISIETGRELITTPISFFNNTLHNCKISNLDNPLYTRQYGDQYINKDELYSHKGDIIVNSFGQRQEYYSSYRDKLKQFFCEADIGGIPHDDTVLYIRNGDYKDIGVYLGLSNYYKILDSVDFSRLTIVVEHIDEDVKSIAQKYNANIFSKSIFDDFLYIKNASNIIMSQSTFSWWAAFLSEAKNIYLPLSIRGKSKGWWYIDPDKDEVDLSLKYNNYNYIILT